MSRLFFYKTLNGFVHNSVVPRHYDIFICPVVCFFLPKKMIDQWSMTTELLLLFLCSYKSMFVASATCTHVCFNVIAIDEVLLRNLVNLCRC